MAPDAKMPDPTSQPLQHQARQPGRETEMTPKPILNREDYRGSGHLEGRVAIVTIVRSLAASLAERGIHVNGVAPGPIWNPLIPATFPEEKVAKFGTNEPLGRAGQPADVAPSFVFLASRGAAYITGQILHPNGGEPVGG